ncbi:hypothetical protein Acr_00g0040150 [Actinidia rufa]|uniref:Uncharacterized protein n=1 Tax=Actinidia rufa TaxID=165716 RepID=A0A7J0DJG8_9ERIC|nr:hypothetical protein Acr_00g0040150 [Actinidia rufa]
MEILSIQQHAHDTLSRLRMRKRNKNWAQDHMSWGNLLEGGDGTETWARGRHRGGSGGWWQDRDWEVLHKGRTEEADGCVVSGLRLDRGESGLHRGEAGDWAEQGLNRGCTETWVGGLYRGAGWWLLG